MKHSVKWSPLPYAIARSKQCVRTRLVIVDGHMLIAASHRTIVTSQRVINSKINCGLLRCDWMKTDGAVDWSHQSLVQQDRCTSSWRTTGRRRYPWFALSIWLKVTCTTLTQSLFSNGAIQSNPIRPDLIRSDPIWSDPIQSDPIQSGPTQYNLIQ